MSEMPDEKMKHVDEMTLLLYIERQLERARGLEVSAHTQECDECSTLLRALERESRLQQLEKAGFGGSNLLGLLIFQGAMWKGWQSMITLLEVLAMVTLAGLGAMFFRRRIRRGSALALVFAGFCTVLALPTGASATEHRGGQNPTVGKDETIKGDVYLTGERVRVEGTVDGDVFAAGKDIDIDGHVTGDVISAGRYLRIRGTVDGNVRSCGNTAVISGNLGKNIMWFGDAVTVDATGKVGGGVTMFGGTLAIDGHLNRDILFYGEEVNVNGAVGGGIREKGNMMIIGSNAQVDGPVKFEGNKPADVAPGAKLASPVEFKQMEKRREYRQSDYYIWRLYRGWHTAGSLRSRVLDSDALLCGNRSGCCGWQFDPRQGDGHLGHDRKNGAGVRNRANRLHTVGSCARSRIVGRAGHLDVGHGSDLAGALPAPPAGDCAERALRTIHPADGAEYDGGWAAAGVRRVRGSTLEAET